MLEADKGKDGHYLVHPNSFGLLDLAAACYPTARAPAHDRLGGMPCDQGLSAAIRWIYFLNRCRKFESCRGHQRLELGSQYKGIRHR